MRVVAEGEVERKMRSNRQMTTFTLRYGQDGFGLEKRIEFDAASPAQALLIVQGEAAGRWAELSADGKPICRLGRAGAGAGDYWVIR